MFARQVHAGLRALLVGAAAALLGACSAARPWINGPIVATSPAPAAPISIVAAYCVAHCVAHCAAYCAPHRMAFGDEVFTRFESDFLLGNLRSGLVRDLLLSPATLHRLSSP